MPPQRLYVQCNPILDISAHVSDEFLAKYKVERGAASLLAEDQKEIFNELEKLPNVVYVAGGSGLNTARVAQWLLQCPKNIIFSSYVGCIADDRYGKLLRNSAENDGVVMTVEYTNKENTGSCAVCINGKERSLVANLAAANCLSASHMQSAAVQKIMNVSKIFYLTGYTLTVDVEHVLLVAKKCREVGGVFIMNLSAPFIIQFYWKQFEMILPFIDIIIGNAQEAQTLSTVLLWETHDVSQIALRALQELPYSGKMERLIVFTQGPDDTLFINNKEKGVTRVPVPKLKEEVIVDLNAAGDAFVGGFLAAYAIGKDIIRCCDVGSYAAQVIIQHNACTFPEKPSITP